MSDSVVATSPVAPVTRFASSGPEHCLERRPDGVFADPAVLGTTILAAVDSVLRSGRYFTGLN